MEENGFTVVFEDIQDFAAVKARYLVPAELQSCHTAVVDGYVIEGHVPAADIERLLMERPEILGLAVAGMPAGSPGMDFPGAVAEPFDVVMFDENGPAGIFASYP